ncbi:MAG: BACON domain-containing protein [Prevotellaceae bacterium]|jgi:hypothetical protein|nr:BACON domain-containing protein [Prevotellaceae bacterium]
MKKIFFYTICLCSALLFATCTENETLSSDRLTVDKTSIQASAIGGTVSFGLYTDARWTITSDASWLTILSPSGAGMAKIIVRADINTLPEDREALLRITAGEDVLDVRVVQPALTPPERVDGILGDDVNACPVEAVSLSILPVQNALSYIWYRDGLAIPSGTATTLVVTKSGDYTVASVNPAGTATVSPVKTVRITPCPPAAAGAIAGDGYNVCPEETVTLSIAPIESATAYQWYKNSQLIPGATAASYTVAESGSYTVAGTSSAGTGTPSPVKTVMVGPCGASIVDEMVGEWKATETIGYLNNGSWTSTPSTFTITMEKLNATTVKIRNVAGGRPAEPEVTLIGQVDLATNVLSLPCQVVTPNWYSSSERTTYFIAMVYNTFLLNMGIGVTAWIDRTAGKPAMNIRSGNGNYSYAILMVTDDRSTGGSRYYALNTRWEKQ